MAEKSRAEQSSGENSNEANQSPNYNSSDYYERLGVPKDASQEEIAIAYRQAARKTHPDKGGKSDDFRSMQEAFDVLHDPGKRADYDAEQARKASHARQSVKNESGTANSESENKENSLDKAVSEQEVKEGEDSKWLKGAKSFIKGGAGKLGFSISVLLGFAATVLAKLFEASAGVIKNMAEKPKNPEEWFKPMIDVWKKEKKKEK